MSAVEEIEAAIAKLTDLRDASTPGPWTDKYGDLDGADFTSVCDMEVRCGSYCQGGTAPGMSPADMALIVTLHRTCGAQLAILQAAVEHAPMYEMHLDEELAWIEKRPSLHNGLELARAINGTPA